MATGERLHTIDVSDLRVLVTAGGGGIGRVVAEMFVAAGARVHITDVSDAALRDALSHGTGLTGTAGDAATPENADRVFDDVATRLGGLDVLVNNVGIARDDLAQDVKEADFDLVLATNVKGTFFMTQAVAKTMIARKSGRIVNISSQAGTVTLRGEAVYCMTKAAINHLTRCLAVEWAPLGLAVNSVSPTFIWTDGTRPYLSDPDSFRQTVAHIPVGRVGETKDVTGAVVFLASPAASLINGADLLVDGGWSVA